LFHGASHLFYILAAPTDLSWLVIATERLSVFAQWIMAFDSGILSLQ